MRQGRTSRWDLHQLTTTVNAYTRCAMPCHPCGPSSVQQQSWRGGNDEWRVTVDLNFQRDATAKLHM